MQGKVFPKNCWAEAHPWIVNKAIEEHTSEGSDSTGDIGVWQPIIYELVKKLLGKEQSKWKWQVLQEHNPSAAAANEMRKEEAKIK